MSKISIVVLAASLGAIVALLAVGIARLAKSDGEYVNTTTQPETLIANDRPVQTNPVQTNDVNSIPLPLTSSATRSAVTDLHPVSTQTVTRQNSQIDNHLPIEVDQTRMLGEIRTQHEQRVTAHNQEVRNRNWSYRMESKLQDGFQSIPENSLARMGKPDCRSQTCAVEITWPSLDAAKQELTLPSQLVASIPCANSVVLPDDTSGGGEYRATMLVDCTGRQTEAVN